MIIFMVTGESFIEMEVIRRNSYFGNLKDNHRLLHWRCQYWLKNSVISTTSIITLFLTTLVMLGERFLSKSRNLPYYAPVITSLQFVFNTMSAEECPLTMTKQGESSLFFTQQNILIFLNFLTYPHYLSLSIICIVSSESQAVSCLWQAPIFHFLCG